MASRRNRKRTHRALFLICLIASTFALILLFIRESFKTSVPRHQGRRWWARLTTTSPPALEFPLWWAAPFYSATGGLADIDRRVHGGYGIEAVSYAIGLLQYDLIRPEDLWLTQSGDTVNRWANSLDITALLETVDYGNQLKILSPRELSRPTVVICHSFPDLWLRPNETYPTLTGVPCPTKEMMDTCIYRIGRTMFETDRLPKHLLDHLLQFDEIWVPSEFNRQVFAASGIDIKDIYLLPESINLTLYDPAHHEILSVKDMPLTTGGVGPVTGKEDNNGNKSFVFLSIFKWEGRKGYDLLLKAFLEEFKAEENVELHIATQEFMEHVWDWHEKVQKTILERCNLTGQLDFKAMPRIFVTADTYIQDKRFPGLFKGADALVIPTRGEGWGRPQMEAMAMGLPVISTNWSGLTAFLNERTGYPIEVEDIVEAKPDGPSFSAFFEGTRWAQPSLKHLRQLMRHVFENREEARAKGAAARRYLEENFSPESVARGLQRLIIGAQERAKAKGRRRPSDSEREKT